MQPAALEKLVWVLIYGGLLTLALGLALLRTEAAWGWALVAGGIAAVTVGAVLIFVRSRMSTTEPESHR